MLFSRLTLCCLFGLFSIACSSVTKVTDYPKHWWESVPRSEAKWWEILPQDADKNENEVVLSKRNELGILSNFAKTPFEFDGKKFSSVEGFWQMLKFPEDKDDPRNKFLNIKWTRSRQQVGQMYSFAAKRAGYEADKNMELMGINWVTYNKVKMPYKQKEKGQLYRLIKRVMWAKLNDNPNVRKVLLATKGLRLMSDHKIQKEAPPVWLYHKMWMEIRKELIHKVSMKSQAN